MRIIAVDDEKIALEALSSAIKAIVTEDEVVSFRYPEDALAYARENFCDIAFLDVEMVGMSGVDLAEKLKKYNNEKNGLFRISLHIIIVIGVTNIVETRQKKIYHIFQFI